MHRFIVQLILAFAGYGLTILFLLDDRGDSFSDNHAASYSVTIILTVVHFTIRHAAMAKCFVEGAPLHDCCGKGAKCCGKATGQAVILQAAIFACACFAWGYENAEERGIPQDKINKTFLMSQAYTAVTGFFFYIAMFVFYWWGCCCCNICVYCCGNGQGVPYDPKRISAQYPYWDKDDPSKQYPTDMDMLWKNDRCGSQYDPSHRWDFDEGPPVRAELADVEAGEVVAGGAQSTPPQFQMVDGSDTAGSVPVVIAPDAAAVVTTPDAAAEAAEQGRSDAVLQPCRNGCGWSSFGHHTTCCRSCHGVEGPHADDCSQKNQKVGSDKL